MKGAVMDLRKYFDLIKSEHKALRIQTSLGGEYNSLPTRSMVLSNIDTNQIKSLLPDYLDNYVTDKMLFTVRGNKDGLEKKDLAILDLIVANNWERPIYFNFTSLSHFNIDASANIIQEGICYRLLPVNSNRQLVNKELMYENMMEKFSWVNLDRSDIYYSEDYRGFCQNLRSAFNTLAQEFINAEEYETAREVLIKCLDAIPNSSIPYDYFSVQQVGMLMELGERERALHIAENMSVHATQTLDYMVQNGSQDELELQRQIITINELARAFRAAGEKELAAEYEAMFEKYYTR